MILVIIIMVAWLVILGPNLLKHRSRTVGAISSISHFHRQLRVLEHSGPEPLVTPAYRLRSVEGSSVSLQGADGGPRMAPKLSVVGADQLPRPALAFLGEDPVPPVPVDGEAFPPVGGGRGTGPATRPYLAGPAVPPTRPSDAQARTLARRRRRDTLAALAAVVVTTLFIGFIPGASAAWFLTLVSGLALTGYVVLLVRMRQAAEERERKLHYLRPRDAGLDDLAPADAGAAHAVLYGGAERPVRVSGRYAHPSNQVAAAR